MARTLPTIAALALGALVLGGCTTTTEVAGPASGSSGIVARGVGKISGTPDTVTLTLGVTTRGPSAKAVLDDNSAKANGLIASLKGKGVAEKDIRTSQLNISPTTNSTGTQITGYEVSNMVTATVRDVAASGGVIDAAAAAVGDAVRVQNLSFSISDDSALRAQARADAVRLAQAQAKQLAEAAGVPLGKIRTISEVQSSTPIPYANMDTREAAPAQLAAVQPGSQELTVTVDVVYEVG